MVYELRVYRCMPGRKADVLARFRDHTMRLFTKHGVHVVGFWETLVGEVDELVYITRFETWEAAPGDGLLARGVTGARRRAGATL